jgi:hypothetical protein
MSVEKVDVEAEYQGVKSEYAGADNDIRPLDKNAPQLPPRISQRTGQGWVRVASAKSRHGMDKGVRRYRCIRVPSYRCCMGCLGATLEGLASRSGVEGAQRHPCLGEEDAWVRNARSILGRDTSSQPSQPEEAWLDEVWAGPLGFLGRPIKQPQRECDAAQSGHWQGPGRLA